MADLEKSVRRSLVTLTSIVESPTVDVKRCRDVVAALDDLINQLLDKRTTHARLGPQLWADALLLQAREDLLAVDILVNSRHNDSLSQEGSRGPASVIVMLLQMYFEKVAKAALARTDTQAFNAHRASHTAASKLVSTIKNHGKYVALKYDWKDILPLIQAMERAHPAVAKNGPHLEYPWESGEQMALPGTGLQIVRDFDDPRNPSGPKLLRFAHELSDRFDDLFQ